MPRQNELPTRPTPNGGVTWASASEFHSHCDMSRVFHLEVQCREGHVVLLDALSVPMDARYVTRSLPTQRELLEHVHQQVTHQLAILSLEGK
jgi:hypothetical protein